MPPSSLLLLVGLPLAAALLLPLLPAATASVRVRNLAALSSAGQLLLGLAFWRATPSELHQAWLPKLGLSLDLGLDGLSLPLVLLTALITTLAILAVPADGAR